jgi:serine/threonine protein kinase
VVPVSQVQRTAAREVRVLRGLRHDNVVRLLEAFRAAGRLFLVFELAEQTVLQVGEACAMYRPACHFTNCPSMSC